MKPPTSIQESLPPAGNQGRWPVAWALASLSLSLLLASLGTSIANVALPTLANVFSATFQQVQWIVLSYLLVITCLIVSAGRLGDMIGRRRLLLGGLLVFTFASALCGLSPALGWLIVARAVQGAGAAVMMAMTLASVGEFVPKEKTGRVMGLLGTMSAIGTALGPTLGGLLIADFGWSAIFFVNVPLGLLAVYLTYRFLPLPPATAKADLAGFDYWGTVLLAGALSAYALAMTLGRGHFGLANYALLLAAGLIAALFVRLETRSASPLIRLGKLRDIELSSGLAANVLVATVVSATLVVGPFYLAQGLGLQAATVGLVMSAGPLVSIFSGVLAGRLVDSTSPGFMTIAGLAIMGIGSLALALLPSLFGVAAYVAAIAIIAPGYQLFQAANNTSVMAGIPADQRGVISGLLNLSRNLGLITGASLMGAVFAYFSAAGDAGIEDTASGFRATFVVAALLMALALSLALVAHHRRNAKLSIEQSASSPSGRTAS